MSMPLVVARFSAFRTVPSRGVAVLTMDVPESRAEAALEVLGSPRLGESIHVAVTRLQRELPAEDGPPPPPPLYGTFEKVCTVASREALCLTIEIPGEMGHRALKQLTIPTKSSHIEVAIARLLEQPQRQTRPSGRTPGELAIQRCAMRVKDEPFQRFILGTSFVKGYPDGNELEATEAVRRQLGIRSRSVFREDHEKLREWWAMEARYEEWLQNGGIEISVARDAR